MFEARICFRVAETRHLIMSVAQVLGVRIVFAKT